MFKIFLTTLVLTVFTFADGPVLKTGQTTSYDTDGNVVTDGSVKDDGYYQAGVARRYGRSAAGVVTDHTTGLKWQDNVVSTDWPWVTQDNYNDGNYSDTAGDTATTYCNNLSLDDQTWRLPSIQELLTLPDASQYDPSLTEGVFNHFFSGFYWSSTTTAAKEKFAWNVYFVDGSPNQYYKYNDKDYKYYVRCVCIDELEAPYFNRNNVTEIVTDVTTGLQWQDNDDTETVDVSWTEAIDYCEKSELGTYIDWRLPNKNELLSIVDYSKSGYAIYSAFENLIADNWTSTSLINLKYDAWFVDFSKGNLFKDGKNFAHDVRCVRGGQLGTSASLPPVIMYLLN